MKSDPFEQLGRYMSMKNRLVGGREKPAPQKTEQPQLQRSTSRSPLPSQTMNLNKNSQSSKQFQVFQPIEDSRASEPKTPSMFAKYSASNRNLREKVSSYVANPVVTAEPPKQVAPLTPYTPSEGNKFIELRVPKNVIAPPPQKEEKTFRRMSPFRQRDQHSKSRIFGGEGEDPPTPNRTQRIVTRSISSHIQPNFQPSEDFDQERLRKTEIRKQKLADHYRQFNEHWNSDTVLTYKEILSQLPHLKSDRPLKAPEYEDPSLTAMKRTMQEKAAELRKREPNSVILGVSERETRPERTPSPQPQKGFQRYKTSSINEVVPVEDVKVLRLTPSRKSLLEQFRNMQ